jgi:hypothetical protein
VPEPSVLKRRLRFILCLLSGIVLALFGMARWSPLTDFRYGHADSLIATLDYGAATAFFVVGPMLLGGWKWGKIHRPEGVPELAVLAVLSLMAGVFFFLLWVGAVRGLVVRSF